MRKPKIAPMAKAKDFGIDFIDLHSELFEVAASHEMLGEHLTAKELRRGRPARRAFALLQKLRREVPPSAILGEVSAYRKKVAVEWHGYWIHGDIPVVDFLDAIERALDLALSGDADFTRPLRELNQRFPYRKAENFSKKRYQN